MIVYILHNKLRDEFCITRVKAISEELVRDGQGLVNLIGEWDLDDPDQHKNSILIYSEIKENLENRVLN